MNRLKSLRVLTPTAPGTPQKLFGLRVPQEHPEGFPFSKLWWSRVELAFRFLIRHFFINKTKSATQKPPFSADPARRRPSGVEICDGLRVRVATLSNRVWPATVLASANLFRQLPEY